MEKMKALFDAVIAYCAKEPFHAVVLIGLFVFLLAVAATIVTLTVLQAKKKEQTNTRQSEPSTDAENTQEETAPPPAYFDELPEEAEDELPLEDEEYWEDEEQEEENAAPIEIVTQARPMKQWEKPKNKSKTIKNKQNNTSNHKEGKMLHDELKDVNTELDFYEEDASDAMARYRGKWVICRVVTNDKETENLYFFELRASNGEKLLSSEEYVNYNGALRGIETHKANILRNNFRISLSKKGDYIFKLLNGKGMLLCMGEHYPTKANCESAIESTKRFARTAFIDENVQDIVIKVPEENDSEPLPLPENYNGKWIIDCNTSPDGERAYFFELFANNGERLLSSEEYSTYIGAVNGIQTHKTNIKNGNFRIFLTKQGDYIYKLLNGNGQLLCLGEHYKTKRLCENAVESVKRFAANAPVLTDSELPKE